MLLSDGRVVEGELECLDKSLNLILRSSREYLNAGERTRSDSLGYSFKNIGTVMVPGHHVVHVLAQL